MYRNFLSRNIDSAGMNVNYRLLRERSLNISEVLSQHSATESIILKMVLRNKVIEVSKKHVN